MPLVQLYKARKAHKRSKQLKGRPEWQDVVPDTREGRDAYKIADKYQRRFSTNFTDAMNGLLEGKEVDRAFKRAWKSGSIIEIMDSLPLFAEGLSDEDPVWSRFQRRMSTAYEAVMLEAGTDAMNDLNRELGTNLGFTTEDVEKAPAEDVEKAEKKKFKPRPTVPVVPVNPYSKKWIREHVLELVGVDIGPTQRKVVERILIEGFEQGIRAEEALKTIRANIGLTEREYGYVENRRDALGEIGMPQDKINQAASKYTEQLTRKRAMRIARTETMKANAQGRSDAWRAAIDEGSLSKNVERKWLTPPPSPNPSRPCEICLGLNETTAPVGGVYESHILGAVPGPPSHPNCRCSETLVRVKE